MIHIANTDDDYQISSRNFVCINIVSCFSDFSLNWPEPIFGLFQLPRSNRETFLRSRVHIAKTIVILEHVTQNTFFIYSILLF